MSTIIPSTTAAASTKPGGSGACACTGCALAATQARHGWMDASLCLHTTARPLRTHLVSSAPGANISQIMAFRHIPRQRPGCRGPGVSFIDSLSPVLQLELLHNSAVESDAANGPENGHAPLHGSHHCCGRLVAHLSFQCGRRTAIWSGRAAGSGGRILRIVGRFPPFVEASSA